MNTTRFEYLLALERTGTMTGVAKAYFISPSAVSQCLKNEEAQLGHPLFRSENHRMVPTEAGQIYLNGARKILEIREATMDRLNIIPQKHHSIRLAVAPMLYEKTASVIIPELNALAVSELIIRCSVFLKSGMVMYKGCNDQGGILCFCLVHFRQTFSADLLHHLFGRCPGSI